MGAGGLVTWECRSGQVSGLQETITVWTCLGMKRDHAAAAGTPAPAPAPLQCVPAECVHACVCMCAHLCECVPVRACTWCDPSPGTLATSEVFPWGFGWLLAERVEVRAAEPCVRGPPPAALPVEGQPLRGGRGRAAGRPLAGPPGDLPASLGGGGTGVPSFVRGGSQAREVSSPNAHRGGLGCSPGPASGQPRRLGCSAPGG